MKHILLFIFLCCGVWGQAQSEPYNLVMPDKAPQIGECFQIVNTGTFKGAPVAEMVKIICPAKKDAGMWIDGGGQDAIITMPHFMEDLAVPPKPVPAGDSSSAKTDGICFDSHSHLLPDEGKCAIKPVPRFVPAIKGGHDIKPEGTGADYLAAFAKECKYMGMTMVANNCRHATWTCSDPSRVLVTTGNGRKLCMRTDD